MLLYGGAACIQKKRSGTIRFKPPVYKFLIKLLALDIDEC